MSKQIVFDSGLGRSEMVALYLGALEKGYQISNVGNSGVNRIALCDSIIPTRKHSHVLNVPFGTNDSITFKTSIYHNYTGINNVTVDIKSSPIYTSPDDLNKYIDQEIYFGSYQSMNFAIESSCKLCGAISHETGLPVFDKNKDDLIKTFDFFIRNQTIAKQLAAISWFNIDPMNLPEPDTYADSAFCTINLRNFAKLRKYARIIQDKLEPSKESVKKTIKILSDVVQILKNGESISSSAFNIRKQNDMIIVKIGGMNIIHEYSVHKYNYLKHPGITLMSAMLEHGNAFLNLDNQFNKSLLRML